MTTARREDRAEMRALFYYPRAALGDGGMTNAVRTLCDHLGRANIEVTIGYDGGTPQRSQARVRWVPVRHVGPRWLRVPVGIDRALRDTDVMVMHSGWVLHNVLAARAAAAHGIPFVPSPRGAYDPMIVRRKRRLKQAWGMALEEPMLRRARAVHVFFDSERSHLRALGFDRALIVAPNGVCAPQGLWWDGGSGGYVLWLGRFDPEHKGLDLLLAAMAWLPPAERPPLRLHGPDSHDGKREVARRIEALGLARDVTLGAAVYGDAKWSLLRRAAGFVYPSRWEAFGNAPAEAASIGVPTLVTPYPLGTHLAERGGAILVDATPAALADGIRRLRRPDAAAIGRAGARIAAETLSWDAAAQRWCGQLQTVLR